jgi:ABC-type dipeptide/oligopeptide/nickel transport system permease subunit
MADPTTPIASDIKLDRRQRTLWHDAVRRFRRNRLGMLGLILVAGVVLTAILADVLAPYPYDKPFFDKVLQLPFLDPAHILGNDEVGRDFLSRLIFGARTSITVGLVVQFIAFGIGIPLGAIAGYRGGVIDFIVMRLIDIMTAFPGLLFAIFLITIWGGGIWKVILVLGFTSWLGPTRLVRAQFLSLREKEFVEAARCMGARQRDILFRHILPNTLAPLLVALSFGIPGAIFGEAGLSFLGIGINDPLPSWGKMVGISGSYVRVYWHVGLFPTVLIAYVVAMLVIPARRQPGGGHG